LRERRRRGKSADDQRRDDVAPTFQSRVFHSFFLSFARVVRPARLYRSSRLSIRRFASRGDEKFVYRKFSLFSVKRDQKFNGLDATKKNRRPFARNALNGEPARST